MGKPQVFDDQEQERVFERVAAVDVAKASGVVCLRLPHPAQPAGRRSQVWEVPATMHAVTELAGRLAAEGVQKVTLESTSDYWRIWFYVLEEAGLAVQLVNASQARNLPGRPLDRSPGFPDLPRLATLLPELIRLNNLQAGLATGTADWPALLVRTLTEGGDGYCLHATLAARPDTRDLLQAVRDIGARCGPAIPPGTDFMHYDFTPTNLPFFAHGGGRHW